MSSIFSIFSIFEAKKSTSAERRKRRLQRKKRARSGKRVDPKRSRAAKKAFKKNKAKFLRAAKKRVQRFGAQAHNPPANASESTLSLEQEIMVFVNSTEVNEEWANAMESLDKSIFEAFVVKSKGIKQAAKGKFLHVTINDADFGFVAPAGFKGGLKELTRKFEKSLTFSGGKALAMLKTQGVHTLGGKKAGTGGISKFPKDVK